MHRCLDLVTGKTIRVQKVVLPDGREMAIATKVQTPAIRPAQRSSPRRSMRPPGSSILVPSRPAGGSLLDVEVAKSYWYEMTLEDGSGTIMSIGGDQPLPEKLPAAPAAP